MAFLPVNLTAAALFTIIKNATTTVETTSGEVEIIEADALLRALQRIEDENIIETFNDLVGREFVDGVEQRSHLHYPRGQLWAHRVNGKWHPDFVAQVRVWADEDEDRTYEADLITPESPDFVMEHFRRPEMIVVRLNERGVIVAIEGVVLD
jgi:hypothetical protein